MKDHKTVVLAGTMREAVHYRLNVMPELADSVMVTPTDVRRLEGLRVGEVYVLPLAGLVPGYIDALYRLRTLRIASGRSRALRFVSSHGGWNEV